MGLAVSGGPDSLALLLLMGAAQPAPFRVATVDHGLRAEAAGEAAFVGSVCAARGIVHDTLTVSVGAGPGVQERARALRYRALGHWAQAHGLGAIVVAHHADDQAETMLMRFNRGAGVRGLAAMRGSAPAPGVMGLPLLRPLLGWRRGALAAVVARAGLGAVADPSNSDMRFERVRIREGLASASWIDVAGLAASAAHLAEADAALDWAAGQSIARLRVEGGALWWRPDVPRIVALRVLEDIVARIGRSHPRGRDLGAWHDRLAKGETATLAGVQGRVVGGEWRFVATRPHRAAQ